PEFNVCDTAVLHLGATPFSVYNTDSAEQIAYLFSDAGNRVVICEAQFARAVMEACEHGSVDHVVCIDGRPDGTIAVGGVGRGGAAARQADVLGVGPSGLGEADGGAAGTGNRRSGGTERGGEGRRTREHRA